MRRQLAPGEWTTRRAFSYIKNVRPRRGRITRLIAIVIRVAIPQPPPRSESPRPPRSHPTSRALGSFSSGRQSLGSPSPLDGRDFTWTSIGSTMSSGVGWRAPSSGSALHPSTIRFPETLRTRRHWVSLGSAFLEEPPLRCAHLQRDSSFTRVSIAIQFTSQVFPPSSENDCSKRQELGVTSDITKRTKIALPFSVS